MQKFPRERFETAYPKKVAVVKPENCSACGRCAAICPPGAVRLTHRLYTKDGEAPSGTAPCLTACPVRIPVQTVAALTKEGRFTEALTLIRERTPFPSLCGICDRPCEKACVRDPVAVAELVRTVSEQGKSVTEAAPRRSEDKIAVIGAGPSGLSCAYHLARAGYHKVTVFEKSCMPGGMLTAAVPPFALDRLRLSAEVAAIRALGVTLRCGVEADLDTLRAEGYKAFFVAVGAKTAPSAFPGALQSTAFLRSVCRGEKPGPGRKCLVIGEGFGALTAARAAGRLGASVTLLCPSKAEKTPSSWREAANEGVQILYGRPITAEKSGNSFTVTCNDTTFTADSVITEDAMLPDAEGFMLSAPDVFAGGACVKGALSAAEAVADGKRAAARITRYLKGREDMTAPAFYSLDRENVMIALDTYDKTPRVRPLPEPCDLRHCRAALAPDAAVREAHRCLGCGTAVIDAAKCLGCGLCVKNCAFDALSITPLPR